MEKGVTIFKETFINKRKRKLMRLKFWIYAIIRCPEYNHGYPAVLKNALDSIFPEWNRKAVGFVSYGNAGGARSVEQLRQVVIELQMVPIRSAIHIPVDVYMAVMNEKPESKRVKSTLDRYSPQLCCGKKKIKLLCGQHHHIGCYYY
jgi:hypothetical protein